MKVVVLGVGYVGLPLAVELAKHFETWGLDADETRVAELRGGRDRNGAIGREDLRTSGLRYAVRAGECPPADAYVITVPARLDAHKNPDFAALIAATKAVAAVVDPALLPLVIYESTVFPGAVESIFGPVLEATGLKRGIDFKLGYSPERINQGDPEHSIDQIVKVISAEDDDALDRMSTLYAPITRAGVFRAASIKAAEAAKAIENAQRDINVAFMNEIAQIFARMDLSVWDVLAAARTKWNFLPFTPGLVGGHHLSTDPFYLSHLATQVGHEPRVILAGRERNNLFASWFADEVDAKAGKPGRALVMGLSFKEDVSDIRNSLAVTVVRRLQELGHDVSVHDPHADSDQARRDCGIDLINSLSEGPYDLVVVTVAHKAYGALTPAGIRRLLTQNGLLATLKPVWPIELVHSVGRRHWTL